MFVVDRDGLLKRKLLIASANCWGQRGPGLIPRLRCPYMVTHGKGFGDYFGRILTFHRVSTYWVSPTVPLLEGRPSSHRLPEIVPKHLSAISFPL
jgi:hypothetical protein